MAHAGQRLNGLGEVVGEDASVLAAAPVATHPGQGGAAHGVVDGLLSETNKQIAISLHTGMHYILIRAEKAYATVRASSAQNYVLEEVFQL